MKQNTQFNSSDTYSVSCRSGEHATTGGHRRWPGIAAVLMAGLGLLLSPDRVSAQSIDAEDRKESVTEETRQSASKRMQGASGRLDEERGTKSLGGGPDVSKEDVQAQQLTPEQIERYQTQLKEKYKGMIAKLDRLINNQPYSEQKPNWLFQKAELLWELRHKQYLSRRAEYNQCLEAARKGTTDRGRCEEPDPNYEDAQKIYRQILTQYPDYQRLDEVLYRLGSGLLESGKGAKGVSKLNQLVENYPDSKYKADAHLALAEYFFSDENRLLGAAQENYKKVLNYPNNPNYQYAQYKLAWVYYNRQSYRKSIETFKKVAESESTKLGFQDRAYRDMLKPLAEVENGWEEARDYFIKHRDREFAYDKLSNLASYFEGQGKNQQAIEIYNYFIDKRPNHNRIPSWMESIVVAKKKEAKLAEVEETMNRFIAYLSPGGTWWKKNKDAEGAHNNAMLLIEASLAYLANTYNDRARSEDQHKFDKSKTELYAKSADYYRRFIERFPKKPISFDMNYFLADIELIDLKQYERAAKHYQNVVEMWNDDIYPKDAKKKEVKSMVQDAAFGRVNAYDKLVQKHHKDSILVKMANYEEKHGEALQEATQEEEGPPSEQDRIPKQKLLEYEKGFVKASDQYSEMFPDTDVTPTVDFVAAEVYKSRGHYAEAIPRYENIIENASQHRYASFAGNSLLEANYVLERWDEVERWARYLMENKIFDVTPKEDLRSAIAYAINERAKDLQEKGDTQKAASELLRLADEFPQSDLAPGAIYNAAAIYESGDQVQKAVNNYQRVISEYPKHKNAPQALFVLGAIFEARADFQQAADYFSRLGSDATYKVPKDGSGSDSEGEDSEGSDMKTLAYHEHEKAADAVYNAAGLYEAMEEWQKSIDTYNRYIELFPNQDDIRDVKLKIGYLYQNKGDQKKAMERFKRFLDRGDLKPSEKVTLHSEIGLMIEDMQPEEWKKKSDQHFTASFHTWAELGAKKKSGKKKAQKDGEGSESKQKDEESGNDKLPEPSEEGLEMAWDADELAKRAKKHGWKKKKLEEMKLASRDAAAHARFRQAERVYSEFKAVEFEWPMSVLQERLASKAEWLAAAETMYFQINSMKSPKWASAAVYRIGDMYQRFANRVDELPIPDDLKKKLSERQLMQYNMTLDRRIVVLEEKALKGFQRALNVALELEAYNEWSRKSAEAIANLDSQAYPVTSLEEVQPDHGRVKFYHPEPLAGESAIERLKGRYERNPPPEPEPAKKEGDGEKGEKTEDAEGTSSKKTSGEAKSNQKKPASPSGSQQK